MRNATSGGTGALMFAFAVALGGCSGAGAGGSGGPSGTGAGGSGGPSGTGGGGSGGHGGTDAGGWGGHGGTDAGGWGGHIGTGGIGAGAAGGSTGGASGAGPNCSDPPVTLAAVLDAGPGTCIYVLQPPPDVAASVWLNLYLIDPDSGTGVIPLDTHHLDGWDFTDSTYTAIEIYGPVCDAVQSGRTTLRVMYICLPI